MPMFPKQKFLSLAFKMVIAVLLFYYLYQQLVFETDWDSVEGAFWDALNSENLPYLVVAVLLMLANWSLEALKWSCLIEPLERMSFYRTFQAILCGITFSLFTPNRIGEYGGRIILLEKADKWQAAALSLVGSFSQLLANSVLGIIGFSFFAYHYLSLANWMLALLFVVGFILVIGSIAFFKMKTWESSKLGKLKILGKWKPTLEPIKNIPQKNLIRVLLYSVLRNFVFTSQYLLLLMAFGVPLNLFSAWIMVNSIFFIQTILPSIAIAELGIRGNIALTIFGYMGIANGSLGLLASTFSLWIINLVLPALLGLLILWQTKISFKAKPNVELHT